MSAHTRRANLNTRRTQLTGSIIFEAVGKFSSMFEKQKRSHMCMIHQQHRQLK